MVQIAQNYEIYLILKSDLTSDEFNSELETIKQNLQNELQVSEIKENLEGLRKLAYPVSKSTTGFYILLNFDVKNELAKNFKNVEKKLNLSENIVRYLIVNQTDYLKLKAKEKLNKVEIINHRELNKGKKDKQCIVKYMGVKAIDYKDINFLNQFTSPYAKIFTKAKTGTSSKYQRKVTQAIKRARHMALMPFTPKHSM